MELRVRECTPSFSNQAWGDVVANGCQAEFRQVIDHVTRPASKVSDRAIAGSRQLGERREPIPVSGNPIEIAESERRVLFSHGVVGVSNLIGHPPTLPSPLHLGR